MSLGFIVTQENVDAGTAEVKDLVFHSDHANFKIIQKGTMSLSIGTTAVDVFGTVTHNLGYTPAFDAYAELGGSAGISYPLNSFDLFSGDGDSFSASSGTSNLVFKITPGASAYTAHIYYYIIADPAN